MDNHTACRNLCLSIATDKYDYDLIRHLIKNGADVNSKNGDGITVFQQACKRGFNIEILEFLVKNGADIHAELKQDSFRENVPKSDIGFTSLHFACRYGRHDIVEYLISIGLDVNAISENAVTPIFSAIRVLPYFSYTEEHKNDDCIRTLHKAGAYINHRDMLGWTPLDTAENVKDTVSIDTLISLGAVNGTIST